MSLIFFFSFPRQTFAFFTYCKSWEKLAEVRAFQYVAWNGAEVGQMWHRGALQQWCTDVKASPQCHPSNRAELPPLLGKQWKSSCFPLLCTEEDPANKKFIISFVCDSPHDAERLFLSTKSEWNPVTFHFSDALDYWMCLVHISFCHLFLITLFSFNKSGLWAVWKVAKYTRTKSI